MEDQMTGCLLAAAMCASLMASGSLNDIHKTPGVARTESKAVICTQKTSTVRNVSEATKNKVYARYGVSKRGGWCKGGCEVDHLIALAIGGSNDPKNLWPQTYTGRWNAHMKDRLELRMHDLICQGKITPQQAQQEMSNDWISAYRKWMKH
jgi:hypothetical protein